LWFTPAAAPPARRADLRDHLAAPLVLQAPLPPPPGYFPANNGQYYGGYHPAYPPHRAYPHAPPPPPPRAAPPPPPHVPAPTHELTQTATIRNAVNLKKATLAATPLPGDPSKLAITFTFDASAPCLATTYVAATEAPGRGCRLTTALQPPAPALAFGKGLGHAFPGGDAAAAAAHVVDLSLYGPDPLRSGPLASAAGDDYPLVVRLEVVSERGARAGHALSELSPGGEQPGWAQSQTTFAALRREEDGSWGVRVLKQKIWVEGVSYELQEIYGMEQAVGAAGGGAAAAGGGEGSDAESEERLCVICLVSPRDTTVLPCRHLCMCHECAQELRKQSSKCPICRNHVESLLHIRINTAAGGGRDRGGAQRSSAADAGAQAGPPGAQVAA
jgi:hypothetical protein